VIGNSRLNGNAIAHRYALLKPDERFRLALEAEARGDDVERDRLVATCPIASLRSSDPDYLDQVEASRELATAVAFELGPVVAQLRMLEGTRELAARAFSCGCEATDDRDEAPLVTALTAAADELRAHGAAVFQGFAMVCRKQLRLQPEVVLAAHLGPYAERFALDSLKSAKTNKATVRQWRELYEAHWNRRRVP
jgi:hypothetical protein